MGVKGHLLLSVLVFVGCDQVTHVHLTQVSPSEVRIVDVAVPCGGTCPPVVTETPRPVSAPTPEPECTEAFKVRDHVQFINHCGSPADKEPVPVPVPTPVPPGCRLALGIGKGC